MTRRCDRRTRVATLLPNEASLLRPVTAMVVGVSAEWEIGRAYLFMDSEYRTAASASLQKKGCSVGASFAIYEDTKFSVSPGDRFVTKVPRGNVLRVAGCKLTGGIESRYDQ